VSHPRFFRAFILILALATGFNAHAAADLSDGDLQTHLKANSTLLTKNGSDNVRALEETLEALSQLSNDAFARVVENSDNLLAPEGLNGLLVKEVVEKIAEKRGFKEPADNNPDKKARALKIFERLRAKHDAKLNGAQLLDLYKKEIKTDDEKIEIMRKFDAQIQKQIDAFDAQMPELFHSAAFRVGDPTNQAFLQRLSIEYFTRLTPGEKRLMLLDALKSNPRSKVPDVGFDVLFRHAGPQYQKLLQIVAREEGLDPEFAKTLKKLESSVPESPFSEVERFLRTQIPETYPAKLRIVAETPLGSGTLAQTYSAVMIENGVEKPVALRVLRPGIAERIREEKLVFETITPLIEKDPALAGTPFTNFGMIWQRIAENVDEELHVEITAHNQSVFQNLFHDRPNLKFGSKGLANDIRVPKVHHTDLATKGVLVQEYVNGISFERMGRENPAAARAAAVDFATAWVREALFVSGYHHSDPHQGNLRVAAANSSRPQVYLLDYGMVGYLGEKQRSDLLLLNYALRIKDVESATLHVSQLISTNPQALDTKLITQLVTEELTEREPSAPGLLEKLVVKGQKLPRELVSFNRGYFMINQLLRQTGSPETLFTISARMGQSLIGQDIMKRVIGTGNLFKENPGVSPLSVSQLWRITGHEVKNACSGAVMKLLRR